MKFTHAESNHAESIYVIESIDRLHVVMMELHHIGNMIADLRGDPENCRLIIRHYGYVQENMGEYERAYVRGLLTDNEWAEAQLQCEMVSAAIIALQ